MTQNWDVSEAYHRAEVIHVFIVDWSLQNETQATGETNDSVNNNNLLVYRKTALHRQQYVHNYTSTRHMFVYSVRPNRKRRPNASSQVNSTMPCLCLAFTSCSVITSHDYSWTATKFSNNLARHSQIIATSEIKAIQRLRAGFAMLRLTDWLSDHAYA